VMRAETAPTACAASPWSIRKLERCPVASAASTMADVGCGFLPVVGGAEGTVIGVITDRDLAPLLRQASPQAHGEQGGALSLEKMEHVAIERALRLCQGNRTKAARLLGISRDTLYRKVRDLGISM